MRHRKTIKHRIICASILGILTISVIGFDCILQQQRLSSKLIRLHVIANSDSETDQSMKCIVRDSVSDEISVLLAGASAVSEAEKILTENLPALEVKAEKALLHKGCTYSVSAVLASEVYPPRNYGAFNLPAGTYKSLKVVIGEGMGKNWWCVVFPPLCFSGTAEFEDEAREAGLTEEEIRLISERHGSVVFRFKVLELFEKLIDYFRSKK